jgi:hypothetical protein
MVDFCDMIRIRAASFGCLLWFSVISLCQTTIPVTLRMSWALGDARYGPNFLSLHTKCAKPALNCSCIMNFKVINSSPDSAAFAHYIRSFANNDVPVTFKVSRGADNRFLGASLISVGNWPAEKFGGNDRLLGVQIKTEPAKEVSVPLNSPGECFQSY